MRSVCVCVVETNEHIEILPTSLSCTLHTFAGVLDTAGLKWCGFVPFSVVAFSFLSNRKKKNKDRLIASDVCR